MIEGFAAQYSAALNAHLASPREETLAAGYELGRSVLQQGNEGVLDVAAVHHRSLARLAAETRLSPNQVEAAAAFFGEVMSVFEMVSRGYRAANTMLEARNRELELAKTATEGLNRDLESFSYSVSHDLRAPLRSIDGFSAILAEDYAERLDEEGREHLRRVRSAAQRMEDLIEALIQLARLKRGSLSRSRFDLGADARAVAEELAARDPARRVAFVIPEHLDVDADRRLVRVLLDNLIGNAWKFTGRVSNARIEVGRVSRDGNFPFFVRDNGVGFDMKHAAKLFSPFVRLHSDAQVPGTGIGLATVQRIADRHGGRCWAESEPDRGATFFFTLEPRPGNS